MKDARLAWSLAFVALGVLGACHHEGAAEGGAPMAACPPAWIDAPTVDPSIAVPAGQGRVVLHAAATGTQNYACTSVSTDGGASYGWSLAGPEASLTDCHAGAIGRHFASDAGPSAPEWQWADGAYVVAHKLAAQPGAGGAVPWLLLRVDRHEGAGPLGDVTFVQRVRTSGGAAPSTSCDASAAGTVQKVPYTADYYFYAP